ncbi:MAG: hypothetical protein LBQ54_00960 [Planctomycetaceae bacterium]|jgi:hypothetical protein|nr:hypothetical protein [Planctomycetaceae bacterium]
MGVPRLGAGVNWLANITGTATVKTAEKLFGNTTFYFVWKVDHENKVMQASRLGNSTENSWLLPVKGGLDDIDIPLSLFPQGKYFSNIWSSSVKHVPVIYNENLTDYRLNFSTSEITSPSVAKPYIRAYFNSFYQGQQGFFPVKDTLQGGAAGSKGLYISLVLNTFRPYKMFAELSITNVSTWHGGGTDFTFPRQEFKESYSDTFDSLRESEVITEEGWKVPFPLSCAPNARFSMASVSSRSFPFLNTQGVRVHFNREEGGIVYPEFTTDYAPNAVPDFFTNFFVGSLGSVGSNLNSLVNYIQLAVTGDSITVGMEAAGIPDLRVTWDNVQSVGTYPVSTNVSYIRAATNFPYGEIRGLLSAGGAGYYSEYGLLLEPGNNYTFRFGSGNMYVVTADITGYASSNTISVIKTGQYNNQPLQVIAVSATYDPLNKILSWTYPFDTTIFDGNSFEFSVDFGNMENTTGSVFSALYGATGYGLFSGSPYLTYTSDLRFSSPVQDTDNPYMFISEGSFEVDARIADPGSYIYNNGQDIILATTTIPDQKETYTFKYTLEPLDVFPEQPEEGLVLAYQETRYSYRDQYRILDYENGGEYDITLTAVDSSDNPLLDADGNESAITLHLQLNPGGY